MRSHLTRLAVPLLLAGALTACGADVFTPSEEEARAAAEVKWLARPFGNYSFEMMMECQCRQEALVWNRVEVRTGVVSRVLPVGSNQPYPTELLSLWLSVEQLFVKLKGPHPNQNTIDIRAQYDATLGYPTRADFIYSGLFSDATITYHIRNVAPLN